MHLFHILDLEKFQHVETFEIIHYSYFLDIWIQQQISFLLILFRMSKWRPVMYHTITLISTLWKEIASLINNRKNVNIVEVQLK